MRIHYVKTSSCLLRPHKLRITRGYRSFFLFFDSILYIQIKTYVIYLKLSTLTQKRHLSMTTMPQNAFYIFTRHWTETLNYRRGSEWEKGKTGVGESAVGANYSEPRHTKQNCAASLLHECHISFLIHDGSMHHYVSICWSL